MSNPFSMWDERIAAAQDDLARGRLLAEIGQWRALHLGEVAAQRAATYALSVLHEQLGDRDKAEHEAEQLVELCRVPPQPPAEVRQAAERHLSRMRRDSPQEKARKAEQKRARFDAALDKARRGAFEAARKALGGGGVRLALARTWVDLLEARASDDPLRALDAVIQSLGDRLGASGDDEDAPAPQTAAAKAGEPKAPRAPEGPVEALLGESLPRKRQARLHAMADWLSAHPDQADALAAAAIREHIGQRGPKTVAPWLFPFTLQGMIAGGGQTAAAIDEAGEAWAVTAYREPGWSTLVDRGRALLAPGSRLDGVRRGVVRAEPDDRPVWQLTLASDDGVRRLAVVAAAEGPWPEGVPAKVATGLRDGPPTVLLAPGEAHAALREAAEVAGLRVVTDGEHVVDAILVLEPAPAAAPQAPTAAPERPARAERAERAPRREDEGPGPVRMVRELLSADEVPSVEALAEPLSMLRRVAVALRGVAAALAPHPPEQADPRLAAVLAAIHHTAPAEVRPIAAIRMALETAAAVPGGAVASLLHAEDEQAARFGGVALGALARVLAPHVDGGWSVDHLDLGVGRREAREVAGLEPIADEVRGLWRLRLVREGASPVTLWWIVDPSPEAVAAAALLSASTSPDLVLALDGPSAEAVRDVLPSVLHGEAVLPALASALPAAEG